MNRIVQAGCKRLALLLLAATIGTALLIVGCSDRGSAPVAATQDAVETTIAGGTAAGPRLRLPADFPSAVPLLPRRRIHCFSPRDDGSISLTCSVPEGRRQAAAFYRQALVDKGWQVTLDSLSGGMNTISARREDGSRLTVNIIVNPLEQRTMIGLYHRPATGD
jgi:hypothetical protein